MKRTHIAAVPPVKDHPVDALFNAQRAANALGVIVHLMGEREDEADVTYAELSDLLGLIHQPLQESLRTAATALEVGS